MNCTYNKKGCLDSVMCKEIRKADIAKQEVTEKSKYERLNVGDPWVNLANAIIMQAVRDYRRARRKCKKSKLEMQRQMAQMQELMDFFQSEWFCTLTNLDPACLIRKLQEEEDEIQSKNVSRKNSKAKRKNKSGHCTKK